MDSVAEVWGDLTYVGQVMVTVTSIMMLVILYMIMAEVLAMVRDSKSFRWAMRRIVGPPAYRQQLRDMPSVAARVNSQRIRMVRRD